MLPACQRLLGRRGGGWALDLHLDRGVLEEMGASSKGEELAEALRSHDLKVASLNLYPLCRFQEGVVKDKVYSPDWWDPLRTDLTMIGARWLAQHGQGEVLTISTLAGRHHPDGQVPEDALRSLAGIYARVAREFARLSTTGHRLVLAPEPEPFTTLQTSADAISLWRALPDDPVVRHHLGICLDACHFSVMGEEPSVAWGTMRAQGVQVAKIQASAALRARHPSRKDIKAALGTMAEPRFLHQTCVSSDGGLRFYNDLPLALQGLGADAKELTCHFHMPLFLGAGEGLEGLETTADATGRLLKLAAREDESVSVFAETYTWTVLGHRFASDPEDGIRQELDWLAAV
ncbi:MAG: hypothetical protein AB7F75_06830 [Planctomycetota bacterium]